MVFVSNTHASEAFYKWVDDKGVTHYSQSPPDESGKIKTQTINVSTHTPRGADEAISNLEKQRAEKEKAKTESKEGVKKTGEKTKVDTSKAPNEYKEKCTQLKQNLALLTEKGGRVSVKDGKGDVHKLTEEEVAKQLDETKRGIKAYCEG